MVGFKRGLVLVAGGLVLSACEVITLTPDRVDEDSGAMVTVSEGWNDGGECIDEEVRIIAVDPVTTAESVVGTVIAGAAGEDWSVDVPAPADRGSYFLFAECDSIGRTAFPEELIVQPSFAPTVDPMNYTVGEGPETVTVAGDFCINSWFAIEESPSSTLAVSQVISAVEEEEEPSPEALPFPTVIGSLGAEEQMAAATEHQPFDETWSLDFTAPTVPGTHQIDIGCTYFDTPSGWLVGFIEGIDGGIGVATAQAEEPELPPFLSQESAGSLLSVQVDGVLELDDDAVDEGDSVTVTNADSSPCDGAVAVQLLDGETVVDSAAPAVTDGAWSATFDDLAEGAYTVVAECTGAEDAGTFSYEGAVLSVAGVQPTTTTTTTTTTTVPGGDVASDSATPVRAQPSFTG